jgi:hypothetical protein
MLRFALILVVLLSAGGCREQSRHFVPAPPPGRDAGIPDAGAATAAAPSGDGGAAGGEESSGGELTRAQADALIAFLDKDLPPDLEDGELFTRLARRCGSTAACATGECAQVLSSCSGDAAADCGAQLAERCPAFEAVAQGASGDALGERAQQWVRDLWGDLVVKLRLSLPEKMHGQVDKLAERHQL